MAGSSDACRTIDRLTQIMKRNFSRGHAIRVIAILTALVLAPIMKSNPYFALSFGFPEMEVEERVSFLAEAGFDGIAPHVWSDELLSEFERALNTREVRTGALNVVGVYFPYNFETESHRRIASRVVELGGYRKIPLWLAIKSEGATEERVLELVMELSDEAKQLGTTVVLYPHDRHYMLCVEDSLDVIEKADRENLFTSLHLHQELRAGNHERLDEIVARAASRSRLCTISGANLPDAINRGSRDWSDVVQPLSESAFDVEAFYRLLSKHGYSGPIGLQNFGIPGDPKIHHRESLALLRQWGSK